LDGNPGIARVPASFGALAKLETLSLDDTLVATVPAAVFEGCVSLKRLSLKKTRIARDENAAAKLRAVAGFDAFDARRARSRDKQIACDVLGSGMDDVLGTNETKR
jgi:Leucine-rich repeat (LRR) protein